MDADRDVRHNAVSNLDEICEGKPSPALLETLIPALVDVLNDEYDQVGMAAARALEKLADPRAEKSMSEPTDAPMLASRVVAERTHLTIPSLPNWIEPTVEYLRHKAVQCGACQPTRAGKLLVTLHEAITNAVVHAYH